MHLLRSTGKDRVALSHSTEQWKLLAADSGFIFFLFLDPDLVGENHLPKEPLAD